MSSFTHDTPQGPQGLRTSSEYGYFRSSFLEFGKSLRTVDDSKNEVEWVCDICSYHNADWNNVVCSMCGGISKQQQQPSSEDSPLSSTNLRIADTSTKNLGTSHGFFIGSQRLNRRPSLLASRDLEGILERLDDETEEGGGPYKKDGKNESNPDYIISSSDNLLSHSPDFKDTTQNAHEHLLGDHKKPAATLRSSKKKIIVDKLGDILDLPPMERAHEHLVDDHQKPAATLRSPKKKIIVDKLGDILDLPPMERVESGSTATDLSFHSEMKSDAVAKPAPSLITDRDEEPTHNNIVASNSSVATSCDYEDARSVSDDHGASLSEFFLQGPEDTHIKELNSSSWMCEFCTFVNQNDLHLTCEICKNSRDGSVLSVYADADVKYHEGENDKRSSYKSLPDIPNATRPKKTEEEQLQELLLAADRLVSAETPSKELEDAFRVQLILSQSGMLDAYKTEHQATKERQNPGFLQQRNSLPGSSVFGDGCLGDSAMALVMHEQKLQELEIFQEVQNQRRAKIIIQEGPNAFDSVDGAAAGSRPPLKRGKASKLALTWTAQQRMLDDWKEKAEERSNNLSNSFRRQRNFKNRSGYLSKRNSIRRSSA